MSTAVKLQQSAQQIRITFIQPDGLEQAVSASCGDTLMDAALDNGIAGIVAQCGGGCTCCTCHCWVQQPWLAQLPVPHQDELDMLAYAWGQRTTSRLACQVKLAAQLNGMRVDIPARQS